MRNRILLLSAALAPLLLQIAPAAAADEVTSLDQQGISSPVTLAYIDQLDPSEPLSASAIQADYDVDDEGDGSYSQNVEDEIGFENPFPYYSYPYFYDDYGNSFYYPFDGYGGIYLDVGVGGGDFGHQDAHGQHSDHGHFGNNTGHGHSGGTFASRYGGRRYWNGNAPGPRGFSNRSNTRTNGFHGRSFSGGGHGGVGGGQSNSGGERSGGGGHR